MCRGHRNIIYIIYIKKAVKSWIGGYPLGDWGPPDGRYGMQYMVLYVGNAEMKFGSNPCTWEQQGYILFWGKAKLYYLGRFPWGCPSFGGHSSYLEYQYSIGIVYIQRRNTRGTIQHWVHINIYPQIPLPSIKAKMRIYPWALQRWKPFQLLSIYSMHVGTCVELVTSPQHPWKWVLDSIKAEKSPKMARKCGNRCAY